MGELINKMKQKAACVYSIIIACGKRIAVIFAKFENWLWGLEDKIPWIKNICNKVFSVIKHISTAVFEKINPLRISIRKKTVEVRGRHRKNEQLSRYCAKIGGLAKRINEHLPKHKLPVAIAIVEILIAIWGIAMQVDILFLCVICLWVAMIIVAVSKIEQRAMLFLFSITFFVFLLGREFLQQFFSYQYETFENKITEHTHLCLLLALAGIAVAYWITKRKSTDIVCSVEGENGMVQKVSRFTYFVVLIPAVIYRFYTVFYVQSHGYAAYYTDFQMLLNENILLSIFGKLDYMVSPCVCIYLASMPSKKEFYSTAALYAMYLTLTLGAGARGPFLLGVFFLLFYILYRAAATPAEGWFKRSYLVLCGAFFVFFALGAYFSGLIRDEASGETGLLDGIIGFIYSQGVSINVLKRGFIFKDQIPDGYLYSMNFMRSGFIARLFNIPIYTGNSVETALYGGNFAHALSYLFMPESYLSGHGTGTSYVAELYHDFGYIGVFLGSILYGWLSAKTDTYKPGMLIRRSCMFIMITQLLWAPRGSYSGMLTALLSPVTLFVIVFIFGLSWLLERRKKWRAVHIGEDCHGK